MKDTSKVGMLLAIAAVVISLIGLMIDTFDSHNHTNALLLPLIIGAASILSYRIQGLEKRIGQIEKADRMKDDPRS